MKKKWRRLKKNLTSKIFDLSPTSLRDFILRNKVCLDYFPPPNLKFKLAETKSEMEQAYQLLYQAYVASGSMKPNSTGLRATAYHALPSTSMLIATVDDVVVATVSIFRLTAFGLPISKIYDVNSFTKKGRRIAEISSLCVCDTYKNDHRTLLFGLLKFLYEYSVSFFGIDIKLIVIKPFRRHFYESMLNFEILENRIVHNYEFSNGATVMAEYLDLSQAPEKYKQIYNSYPDEKNLYKYFIETKIDNFHFPDRTYYSISDPKLTPELLHYFFVEKTNTLQNLTQEELTIIKSQYKESEYQNIFAGFTNNVLTLNFFRTEGRFEVKSTGQFLSRDLLPFQMVQVFDVSRNGIKVYSVNKLNPNRSQKICVSLGPEIYSTLTIEPQWSNGLGYYGFKIAQSDPFWENFIDHMEENSPGRRKIA